MDFVKDRIYDPRSELLEALRAGFSMVKISSHLKLFSSRGFEEHFVGVEMFTALDVIGCLSFQCDNEFEVIQDSFKSVVEQAIIRLGETKHSNLTEFVKFITGSSVLQPTRKLIITPLIVGTGDVPHWPEYPLPKAQTCFNTLVAPYLIDWDCSATMEETSMEGNNSENPRAKKDAAAWTVENLLRNFELMLCFNKEAFSDS